ncbi:MAG: tetratricopeptide repeat protein [Bacteriovoracia bacterium]
MGKLKSSILIKFTLLFVFLAMSIVFNFQAERPPIKISKQKSAINFNKEFLKIFHFGQKRLLSAILWIQTVIESDIEHYKGDPFNNWMYLRFDSILSLDPQFLEAYRYGGQYLSIIKDDLKGASDIYDRGLQKYPEDYHLNFNAGFHYVYEVGNIDKGLPLLDNVKNHPKTLKILPSIVARIKASQNNFEAAYNLLYQTYLDTDENSPLKKHYEKSLYALKAEIDLQCLNKGKSSCDEIDFYGNYYIKTTNGYRSKYSWKKYRINLKSKNKASE